MGGSSSSEQQPGHRSHSGELPPNYARPYYSAAQAQPVPYPVPQTQPVPYSVPQTQPGTKRRLDRRFSVIADQYHSVEQVTEALMQAGLESSNLIVGIDFTASNDWTGKRSYNGRSLHHIGDSQNPYEQAISIIGKTMSKFDDDNLIPCYGFGDVTTHDRDVFGFYPDERPCNGFSEALMRYRQLVPHIKLSGPTSFAPLIEMAMTTVEKSGGQYHVLLIIADGQVTRSVDTDERRLGPQEQATVDAIVKASEFPLSIVLVGVGDGPWDTMKQFDDNIPARSFDNFQFVNFTEIMGKNLPQQRKEAEFALKALMEIPLQYKATLELGILGRQTGRSPNRISLPPPGGTPSPYDYSHVSKPSFNSFQHSSPQYPAFNDGFGSPSAPTSMDMDCQPDSQHVCPICLVNPKDMAFGCGHQTCVGCSENLQTCPICRTPIQTRIKLY
ncbi:hypothetical protein LUZ60_015676 [Juncus effusus]|nr:hypothetical protein LUZ60_015676 [Juncus effusus]